MGLAQQPWGCGDSENRSLVGGKRVGASESHRLVICARSFVENIGLSRTI